MIISTPTPSQGVTFLGIDPRKFDSDFYSHALARRDHGPNDWLTLQVNFYSHALARRDPVSKRFKEIVPDFYSHALARRDFSTEGFLHPHRDFYSHALARRDHVDMPTFVFRNYFYSHALARRDGKTHQCSLYGHISTPTPSQGVTHAPSSWPYPIQISTPTPSQGVTKKMMEYLCQIVYFYSHALARRDIVLTPQTAIASDFYSHALARRDVTLASQQNSSNIFLLPRPRKA